MRYIICAGPCVFDQQEICEHWTESKGHFTWELDACSGDMHSTDSTRQGQMNI